MGDDIPAKVANPVKMELNHEINIANSPLTFAKINKNEVKKNERLADVSKSLAKEKTYKINKFSNISKISRGKDINLKYELNENRNSRLPPQNVKKIDITNCPAKYKQSGKCYGKAYFLGKSDKGMICTNKECPWIEKLRKRKS